MTFIYPVISKDIISFEFLYFYYLNLSNIMFWKILM